MKHNLADILTIVMCAVLCGLDDLSGIMSFARNRAAFLNQDFGIEEIPSKPTFSRVLSVINGQKIAEAIIAAMWDTLGTDGTVISVDGMAICSTSEK